ncbi:argininosuccinate synthase [Fusobacterium ulcerans]|uniref:Argininosuccinate synthase n=1 Tax=Fusobacterium ulcerans TaxID=861 RepID=A0AAX2JC42_9FUSO|nr:argininosuccinate synthase [Fusobacterium ulcerans]AVQ26844.1 argininosuccinate synthase [Fusobacterium ulcerans]EFS25037.1 argininosuccinate synthase [Fusobacterium ulcerans ATCC 49185]SQJ08289.1 Argininosuccinate synthase [Fusobacterium ulcerans]
MKEKVVLAYSGGLDTSVIIPWLKENYDFDVIAVAVDVGQKDDFAAVEKKALQIGASKFYAADKKEELVNDFIIPMLKSGAKYEGTYLLGTSIARPVIAKALVEIAQQEGASYIVHGATGKGNDQVRFELGIKALAPNMKVIAPWRIWDIKSRKQEIEYLKSHGIELPFKENTSYSRDENLFHISHEGLELESPHNAPDYNHVLQWVLPLEKTSDTPECISIDFEKGVPVKLNGKSMSALDIINSLNEIGAKHGVGVIDLVENRLVGMKSRGVYETPGGTILFFAHEELERLCMDRESLQAKMKLSNDMAKLIYNGQWFTRYRKALSAFVEVTQEFITGTVNLKLYKGNILLNGMDSKYSLYSEEFSTFDEDTVYNQKDAEGFINLFGLPIKIEALLRNK